MPLMIRRIELYRNMYKWKDVESFILPVAVSNVVQGGISYCGETVKCDSDISLNHFIADIDVFRLNMIEYDMNALVEYIDIFDTYDCYNYLSKLIRNFIRYIYDESNSFGMFFDPLYEVLEQTCNIRKKLE